MRAHSSALLHAGDPGDLPSGERPGFIRKVTSSGRPRPGRHPRVAREPVSARNSATLRDLRIFVDHSAEPVTPNDLGLGYVGLGECS